MELSYRGESSFTLTGERSVHIDPRGRVADSDIRLDSVRMVRPGTVLGGPGEFEIGGVLIVSLRVGDRDSTAMAHAVQVGGANVVYLGPRITRLGEHDVEALGKVDVLLVSADDLKIAQELVADLEPRVVVPYGEKAAELCAALGVKNAQPQPRFAWSGPTARLPRAVLLKAPARAKPGARRRAA